MANDFDKNKQPVEWLLEEIKNSIPQNEPLTLDTVESLLKDIKINLNSSSGGSVIKSECFNTYNQFELFLSNLVYRTLHVKRIVVSDTVKGCRVYYCNSIPGFPSYAFTNVTYVRSSADNSIVQKIISPDLVVTDIVLTKAESGSRVKYISITDPAQTANYSGSVYFEYQILD